MAKATVEAPSNIAFVKYWGVRDIDRAIPRASSLSMTLHRCASRTTVEFNEGDTGNDEVFIASEDNTLAPADANFRTPIVAHLDRIRTATGRTGTFTVATRNGFPAAAGLGSSASGFAALFDPAQ